LTISELKATIFFGVSVVDDVHEFAKYRKETYWRTWNKTWFFTKLRENSTKVKKDHEYLSISLDNDYVSCVVETGQFFWVCL